MAPDVDAVRAFAAVSAEEEALLVSPERPIVLLARRADDRPPRRGGPGIGRARVHAPEHAAALAAAVDAPPAASAALVMTSGNVADEPIVRDAEAAHRVLAPFADGFLDHDRDIFMRVDDSVVRRFAGRTLSCAGRAATSPRRYRCPGRARRCSGAARRSRTRSR